MSLKYQVAHVNLSKNYGPIERQTELLIAALARAGYSQILICRENSYMLNNLKNISNIKAIKIQGIGDVKYMGHVKLGKLAAIVHAHEIDGFKWASLHYMLFGVPYILTVRNQMCLEDTLPTRLIYTWASSVVCNSRYLAQQISKLYDVKPIFVADTDSKLAVNKLGVTKIKDLFKDKFVVCHIGPLVENSKKKFALIEAAEVLEMRIPQLIVLFISAGGDFEILKDRASGMPNVKFLGEIKNATDYIDAVDVFTYPVVEDTILGNNVIDVMHIGTPIVAINNGTLPEIIQHEKTAVVVNDGDVQALAEAIYKLKTDLTFVEKLRENAKEELSHYTTEIMAKHYIDIYSAINLK